MNGGKQRSGLENNWQSNCFFFRNLWAERGAVAVQRAVNIFFLFEILQLHIHAKDKQFATDLMRSQANGQSRIMENLIFCWIGIGDFCTETKNDA